MQKNVCHTAHFCSKPQNPAVIRSFLLRSISSGQAMRRRPCAPFGGNPAIPDRPLVPFVWMPRAGPSAASVPASANTHDGPVRRVLSSQALVHEPLSRFYKSVLSHNVNTRFRRPTSALHFLFSCCRRARCGRLFRALFQFVAIASTAQQHRRKSNPKIV